MSSTISVSEYDALYDGFCRVRAERDAAIARADRLRDALILACNATDGFASLEVSDEFLLAVPGEVAKRIGRLLTRATEAEAAHEDAMRGVLHTLELLNAAETRADAAEAQVAKLREALTELLAVAQQAVDNVIVTCDRMWVSDAELADMARRAIARAALGPAHD